MEHLDQHDHPVTNALRARLAPPHVAEREVASVWAEVQAQVARDLSLPTAATTPRTHTYVWRYISIALLTIGFFAIKQIPGIPKPAPQTNTYSTENGQRANLTLSDGSHVTLAPSTIMRVTGRNVDLQGEAVFTVTQHTSTPFTVKTGNTVTRVLGTTFGIRAYDKNIRVAVQDGKISINSTNVVGQGASLAARPQDATLSAGDLATVSDAGVRVTHNANVSQLLSWTAGRLVFTRTPLTEIIHDLNRWYDLDIKSPNPTLNHTILTLSLADITADDALHTLTRALGARYVRNGRSVTIYPEE